MTTRNDLPVLALTMGDVNGIGPEILAKALARPEVWIQCRPVVIGSVDALREARRFAAACPPAVTVDGLLAPCPSDGVPVFEAGEQAPPVRAGELDGAAGGCAAQWFRSAVRAALDGAVDGVVTCPLNKEGMHLAGVSYPGHTEILAEMTDTTNYRMSLFSDRMRIVFVTAHLPLRDAIDQITETRIVETVHIAADALDRLGLDRRRIAVAGLNPHAGEAGILGAEERTIIAPAVQACREAGVECIGPVPPDAVFRQMYEGAYDLVISLYHDQGHIPLKLIAMDDSVNVTLGTSVVRTSVDHGTAYDIAGRGEAREQSLLAAIRLAADLCGARKEIPKA